jgi:hypothetical protein
MPVWTAHDLCISYSPKLGEMCLEIRVLDVLGHILDNETSVHEIRRDARMRLILKGN